jgi:DNA-binding transcriptional MocR family regulator
MEIKMNKETAVQHLMREQKKYDAILKASYTLDIARGKPCAAQLDAVMDFFTAGAPASAAPLDFRNYGDASGHPAIKKIFADILQVPVSHVISTANASLGMMYDAIARYMQFGALGGTPWHGQKIKFVCPAPGYDRHFAMTEHFGIEMITVPMTADGPDMDIVEALVLSDPSIKGMWCVPKFANPTGAIYSPKTVSRIAGMKTAASDFRVFWDNAYAVHELYEEHLPLANIYEECVQAGYPDRALIFTSTAKILFAGGACSALASSKINIDEALSHISVQQINPNKVWQAMVADYIKDADGLKRIMALHREILAPKFLLVEKVFSEELASPEFAANWSKPLGGYFVSLNVMRGTAKHVWELCKTAGLALTPVGATYPYRQDDLDSNLRIAPTFVDLDELNIAMKILTTCVKIAACEKIIKA